MGIVIQGGTIVTASECYRADLRVDGQYIASIGIGINQAGDSIIDASDCYVMPGGIDPHTHFDLPVGDTVTADNFASGTRAALTGGTTTVIDFATQDKGGTLAQALRKWHVKADGKSFTDYGFHLAIVDVGPSILEELEHAVARFGVSSVKLYLAYKHNLQVDDATVLRTLNRCRELGILVCLHCENGDIIDMLVTDAKLRKQTGPRYHAVTRPVLAEQEATYRAIRLAEIANSPLYIVHVSSGAALEVIQEARGRGVRVSAETCPQYLLLDESCYDRTNNEAVKYVMSPPLRTVHDQKRLWEGLAIGVIDTVGSDHCSFQLKGQKDKGIHDFTRVPNGIPGVENRMGLLYTYGVATGRISLHQYVDLTSTRAAKLFGLYPRKGTLAIGSDADIVVWDPAKTTTISAISHKQHVDYNPFEGFVQQGHPRHVLLRGQPVVENGELLQKNPTGHYIMRQSTPS